MEAVSTIAVSPSAMQYGELMKQSNSLERPASKSRTDLLKVALQRFALLRGEVMDAVRLESYSKALAKFPDDADTMAVLATLAERKRGDYEAKVPELGDLLHLVRQLRREKREREEKRQRDAEWEALKAQCARERAEDAAQPKTEPCEAERRVNAMIEAARRAGSERKSVCD